MDFLWHAILGLIQGITEFLPVSSSGHLAGARLLMEDRAIAALAVPPLLLEVFLHVGTLAAVILIYRRDVWDMLCGAGQGRRTLLLLIVAMVPTGILGLAMKSVAERAAESRTGLGLCFLALTAVLLATRWIKGGEKPLDFRIALLVGLAQGVAVLPGVSRSGLTIAVGMALGLGPKEATRFSFLLSIPAVLAALGLKLLEAPRTPALAQVAGFGLGALVAFGSGCIALLALVRIVSTGRLWWFAPYTAAIGLLLIAAA